MMAQYVGLAKHSGTSMTIKCIKAGTDTRPTFINISVLSVAKVSIYKGEYYVNCSKC